MSVSDLGYPISSMGDAVRGESKEIIGVESFKKRKRSKTITKRR